MIIPISDVKAYLRLDQDASHEDTLLGMLADAAEQYLYNATGRTFDSSNALAKLFCLVLVCDWYEHRELVGKVTERTRRTVESILAQLQYCVDGEAQ